MGATQKIASSANKPPRPSGVCKPARNAPSHAAVRAVLKKCLASKSYKDVGWIINLFVKKKLSDDDPVCMELLAKCLYDMGLKDMGDIYMGIANWTIAQAEQDKKTGAQKRSASPDASSKVVGMDSGKARSRFAPLPPDSDVDMVKQEEELEVEKPEDAVDYIAELEGIIKNPSALQASLVTSRSRVKWKHVSDGNDREVCVQLTLDLNVKGGIRGFFPASVTATGRVRCRPHDDRSGDGKLYKRAANLAAKEVLADVRELTSKVARLARHKLIKTLCGWIEDWRDERYVRKCYTSFRRAKDIILDSNVPGLYGARVYLFGSATTGMVLADSDIDVAVALPEEEGRKALAPLEEKEKRVEALSFLKDAVRKEKTSDVHVVSSAKVPLLRYYDQVTQVDVDITVANDDVVLLSRLLRTHLHDDRRIWNVAMAVKYWAKRRKICGVNNGHINPIGWTIMVIYFLQHHVSPPIASVYIARGKGVHGKLIRQPFRRSISNRAGVSDARTSELLLKFFHFFAYKFDFCNELISIRSSYPQKISEVTGCAESDCIFIEQPLQPSVNVVGHVSAISLDLVKRELRRGYVHCYAVGDANALFAERVSAANEGWFV